MLLKYNTTMSPARHLTRAEQAEIRRRHEQLYMPQPAQPQPEPVPAPPVQLDTEQVSPFPDAFYTALNILLQYGASANIGPTRCARLNYLWFVTTAMAYQWTQPTTETRITGTKDRWDWSQGTPLETNKDQYVWMNHMWESVMSSFVPSYTVGTLLAKERTVMNWTVEQQAVEWTRIQSVGNWGAFYAAWQDWWTLRQADGSTEALTPPTTDQLPNGASVLDVSATVDPATFAEPTKWTPLKVGVKTQKYLTWSWMSVRSTVLSGEDGTIAQNAAKAAFLTDPVAKAAEITEVLTISETLTDAQKVQAEFWAGGPNTVSPPGMMIWFWRVFMQTAERSWSTLVYSGLDLAAHIFETARLVWGLKKFYMEARPIQYIRAQHRGEAITKYDGTPIAGEEWVPYQETNFVTPPFADFPSGHSAFSQSFANVMTEWFGPNIPATPYTTTANDLVLLSPSLATAPTSLVLGTWTFPAAASQIQPTVVPAAATSFSYTTWQELADAAGISRKLGGIHATSAHVGSQALANTLHQRMLMRWGIPKV
jgi:membrane-associated phospholipid phosphatase